MSPRAEDDIRHIVAYYFEIDRPQVAFRFEARLRKRFNTIDDFPEIGRRREEFGPGIHSIAVSPFIVFYRIIAYARQDGIEIVRVLDGRRDLNTLFGRRRG